MVALNSGGQKPIKRPVTRKKGHRKIIYDKISPNQPPRSQKWELSLVTIFFNLSGPKTLRKSKVTTFNMQKLLIFYPLEMEPVYKTI